MSDLRLGPSGAQWGGVTVGSGVAGGMWIIGPLLLVVRGELQQQ